MNLNTYDEWKRCITVLCGIPLTTDYINRRITDLNDPSNQHTQQFIETWGDGHLRRVIGYFEQARRELR